jgi:hypothetical protein
MSMKPAKWVFFSSVGEYPARSVNNALWYGVVCGVTSTASLYDPYIHFSYSSSSPVNGMATDVARIGEDFRTVVSSGSFIPLSEPATTRKSG